MKWRDPDEAHTRLFEVAQAQGGYFSAQQAIKAGYSRRLHHYHAQKGHWLRIDRGIYRLRDYPGSRFEDLIRWTLWSRGKAIVSHGTAAGVHEIGDLMPGRIHLTVPPDFRKTVPPGVVLHKRWLGVREIEDGQGFRLTTALKTIVDLFLDQTELNYLVTMIRDALDRGMILRPDLEAASAALKGKRRKEAKRLLSLVNEKAIHRRVT